MWQTIPTGCRLNRRFNLPAAGFLALLLVVCPTVAGQAIDPFLSTGKFEQGEEAFRAALDKDPNDDQARFSLGIIQYAQAIEHLVQELNRHGFLRRQTPAAQAMDRDDIREIFPAAGGNEIFSHDVFREIVSAWVDQVNLAEQTLAMVDDPDVKVTLYPGRIRFQPVATRSRTALPAGLLQTLWRFDNNGQIRDFMLRLDLGDAYWLRGYLHLQAAIGELLLAHDWRPVIEVHAHVWFEQVETPHRWLLERNPPGEMSVFSPNGVNNIAGLIADTLAGLSRSLRLEVIEPERFATARVHLKATIDTAQQMWDAILAEQDDDHEWIPNPRQIGAMEIEVTETMITTWRATLTEAGEILEGNRLLPFWRHYQRQNRFRKQGINLRKVMEHPPEVTELLLWLQGTAATPYLETGRVTEFVEEDFINRIQTAFGGNFLGFAAWFN